MLSRKPLHGILLFLLIVLLVYYAPAHAAETLTDQQWQQLTQDERFSYRDEKEMHQYPTEGIKQNRIAQLFAALVGFLSSPTGKIIICALLIFGTAFILFRTFLYRKLYPSAPEKKGEDIGLDDDSGDIRDTDWEVRLAEAAAKGDRRMEVRSGYMLLLQLMQKEEVIAYRADKTNYDYCNEIVNSELRRLFQKIVTQYEYAWYGKYPVASEEYKDYMNTFRLLRNKLTGHEQ